MFAAALRNEEIHFGERVKVRFRFKFALWSVWGIRDAYMHMYY